MTWNQATPTDEYAGGAQELSFLSFPPFDFAQNKLRRESSLFEVFWTPACAGVTT